MDIKIIPFLGCLFILYSFFFSIHLTNLVRKSSRFLSSFYAANYCKTLSCGKKCFPKKIQQKKVNIFSHISNEIELKKNDDEEEEDVGIKFSGCFFGIDF